VGADQRVTLRTVTLGRDFGTSVEVLSGVGPDERVVVNPPDSLADGATVTVAKDDQKTQGGQ
jgi:multidrug efflux pump subunit AcrA (membrane-fusion protein)